MIYESNRKLFSITIEATTTNTMKHNIYLSLQYLELKSILRWIGELVEVGNTGKCYHRSGSTHENARVVAGCRQMLFDHTIVDESTAVLPTDRRSINRIP